MNCVIRAGMDEVGYAPTLGPLVVGCMAVAVPEGLGSADLWDALSSAAARSSDKAGDRIQVDDSKLIMRGPNGFKRLETSVLALLEAFDIPLGTAWELFEFAAEMDYHRISRYPWYWPGDFLLPVQASKEEIERKAALMRAALKNASIGPGEVRLLVIFADELNRSCLKTDNKAVVLAQAAAQFLAKLFKEPAPLRIAVDKHGGRDRYDAFLAGVFPFVPIRVIEQGSRISRYVIGIGQKRAEIDFMQGADRADFLAAAASMVSKYVRELFMKAFNIFWRSQVPGLKPTAGYPLDAKRFLYETRLARKRLGIPDEMMVRER
jgi:endonuclease YncB( thermonuclease family)